jgi:dihydropyrimidine dehydrogenase (NAD+) subunit PreT
MVDTSFRVEDGGDAPPADAQARSLRRLHVVLFVLFVAGSTALLMRGFDFYRLSVVSRVDHQDFRVLSPSSNLGHGYGIAGTALILTNLLYLVRRRFARLSVGSLRAWLDVHVFTGLFGGMLVLFHSAFQVRSSIAMVTVGALLVVIGTGLLGRYLYSLAPKPEVERLQAQLRVLDAVGPGMGTIIERRIALIARTEQPPPSLLAVLANLPSWRRELEQRRITIERTVEQYARHFGPEVQLLARPIADCASIYASEVRSAAAGALLRSWRGLHRYAALLMVLLVAMHIGIAWYYGFVWVFSD